MIILENKFSPKAINVSLSDIGIEPKKVLGETEDVIGDSFSDTLYYPIENKDKLLEDISDMVEEIAKESFSNVFPIDYKPEFDLEYSEDETTEIIVWLKPKNPKDKQHIDDDIVFAIIPVELDNDDLKYLLNTLMKVIYLI